MLKRAHQRPKVNQPQHPNLEPPLVDERAQIVASKMRSLLGTQEWDLFDEEARLMESKVVENLITTNHDWRFIQGRIQGIRDARTLPERLIQQLKKG